jgi:hypothetical protein
MYRAVCKTMQAIPWHSAAVPGSQVALEVTGPRSSESSRL